MTTLHTARQVNTRITNESFALYSFLKGMCRKPFYRCHHSSCRTLSSSTGAAGERRSQGGLHRNGTGRSCCKAVSSGTFTVIFLHNNSNYSSKYCLTEKKNCQQEEQQKTKKKKKSTKKKAIVIEEPPKISQDSSSPEHNLDSQDGSLTDHEFNTGTVKSPGGPQPMAPGVFLSQRRPSLSSPNNSTNSTSTNSSSMAKGDRVGAADAKGES